MTARSIIRSLALCAILTVSRVGIVHATIYFMNTSRGFAPFILIVIIGIAVLGGAGWWASNRGDQSVSSSKEEIFSEQNIKEYGDCGKGCFGYWLKSESVSTARQIQSFSGSPKSPYLHDGKQVYYSGRPVPSADLQTFVVLVSSYENFIHGKDALHVYFKSVPIPGADPQTFEVLGAGIYAKDKNAVYNTDSSNDTAIVLQGIDPVTASTPDGWRLVDKNGPYEGPNKVKLLR